LTLFQFHISLECRRAVGDIGDVGYFHRRRATEEVDLLGEDLRVLQFLAQMVRKFLGDRMELRPFDRRDVLDVLHDRLILTAEILIEPSMKAVVFMRTRFDESPLAHMFVCLLSVPARDCRSV
jgi:hypothetical protein